MAAGDQTIIAWDRTQLRPVKRTTTPLDGAEYRLELIWNVRSRRWVLDFANAVGTPIFKGMAIVLRIDMLATDSSSIRPPGQLFVVDDSGRHREPGWSDWPKDFRMIYRPIAIAQSLAGTSEAIR